MLLYVLALLQLALPEVVQKMSPPQLYKRGLVLIDELTLATEWSFGSLGQQVLTDVLLTQHH